MKFSVLLILCLLAISCRSEKSDLIFNREGRKGFNAFKVDVAPTYESLKVALIKRSCFKCHNPDSDEVDQAPNIPLDNYEDLKAEAESVIFTLTAGCEEEDICMPERSANGKPKAPMPPPEVVQAFKDWMDADYPLN